MEFKRSRKERISKTREELVRGKSVALEIGFFFNVLKCFSEKKHLNT